MKKSSFSTLMLSSLAVLSLACYLFLSSVATGSEEIGFTNRKTSTEMEEQEAQKVVLPDVTLAKRLINITKIVMPRD